MGGKGIEIKFGRGNRGIKESEGKKGYIYEEGKLGRGNEGMKEDKRMEAGERKSIEKFMKLK